MERVVKKLDVVRPRIFWKVVQSVDKTSWLVRRRLERLREAMRSSQRTFPRQNKVWLGLDEDRATRRTIRSQQRQMSRSQRPPTGCERTAQTPTDSTNRRPCWQCLT